MIRSTFSSYTTATLALQANQRSLDVIGQNIANINTDGYTRQRVDLVSFNLFNGSHANPTVNTNVGYGVKISGISQLRDPFLDVQYRSQISKVGTADAKQSTLDMLADIFDETDSEGIKYNLEQLRASFNQMNTNVNSESDTIIRARCQTLINELSVRGHELADIRKQLTADLENTHVADINNLLKDISELNDSIWKSQVLGNPALELQDKLNLKIDELASYLPIQVTYKDRKISADTSLSYPEISFVGSDGNKIPLINGDNGEDYAKLEFEKVSDSQVKISIYPAGTLDKDGNVPTDPANPVTPTDVTNVLKEGTLEGIVQMLNQSGVISGSTNNGLGYYEKTFNAFVDTFAKMMNDLNVYEDTNGNTVRMPLFTIAGGSVDSNGNPISFTATNIEINPDWMNGNVHVVTSQQESSGNTATDNLARFIEALDNANREFSADGVQYFKGNFSQAYANLENVLGIDSKSNAASLETHISVVQKTMDNRDALSGVSLDEEGVNILQYQRSYSAAARLMTALDEMMDILINKTGVVGR